MRKSIILLACSVLAVLPTFARTWGSVPATAEIGSVSEISTLSNTLARVVAFNAANTNVWFEATNYYVTASIPCSLQLKEIRDGKTQTVWDQRDWEYFAISNEIFAVTNRNAWSGYQSGTGAANPLTDTTWVSTPKLALAGGLEWQKTFVASNDVFVLVNNGMVTDLSPTNGAIFAIRDLDDADIFTITKTASVTLGADATGVTVTNGELYVHYDVFSDSHPTASVALRLEDGLYFYEEGTESCPATVEWSGVSGDWTAKVVPTVSTSTLFVTAKFSKAGSTVIKSAAPMATQLLCTDGKTKIQPVNNNGTITWEIVE